MPSKSTERKVYPAPGQEVEVVSLSSSQTFALNDVDTFQVLTGSTARTWTVPQDSSVAFPIGSRIYAGSRDTAVLTLSGESGVRLTTSIGSGSGPGASDFNVPAGGTVLLQKVTLNEWMAEGDIS